MHSGPVSRGPPTRPRPPACAWRGSRRAGPFPGLFLGCKAGPLCVSITNTLTTRTARLLPHATQRGCLKRDILNPKANNCKEPTRCYCPLLRVPFPKSGDSARDASRGSDKPSRARDSAVMCPTGLRSAAPRRNPRGASSRASGTPLGPLRGHSGAMGLLRRCPLTSDFSTEEALGRRAAKSHTCESRTRGS